MSIFDEIGETIICLRKHKGFTQEGLALGCGISVSYLRLIEHGDANPPINELWCLAEVLEVELQNPFAIPEPGLAGGEFSSWSIRWLLPLTDLPHHSSEASAVLSPAE